MSACQITIDELRLTNDEYPALLFSIVNSFRGLEAQGTRQKSRCAASFLFHRSLFAVNLVTADSEALTLSLPAIAGHEQE
jgi:hypothetical protein